MRAVYLPQDFSALNMRSPADATTTIMPQRLYMLILGAIPDTILGKITITSNWEGLPTKKYADILTLSYNAFPTSYDGKEVYDYVLSNNMVITKDSSEHNLNKFINYIKNKPY